MGDAENKFVSVIGNNADPWIITASLVNMTGNLINNATCHFVDGVCKFQDLGVDSQGTGYILNFELTYPTTTAIQPIQSSTFDVGGRSFSLEFLSSITLNGEYQTMTLDVGVVDDSINALADPSLITTVVNCELSLIGASGSTILEGQTQTRLTGGIATFVDVS